MKNENTTQRKRRLEKKLIEKITELSNEEVIERKNKRRLYMKKYRALQSEKNKAVRLQHMRQYSAEYRASQSEEDKAARLQHMRHYSAEYRASQSEEDRAARLELMRQYSAKYRASQSEDDRAARLQHMRQHIAEYRASQSEEDRVARLEHMRQYSAKYRASQSEDDRAARLQHMRQHIAVYRASQTEEHRVARLQHMRQHNTEYKELDRLNNDMENSMQWKMKNEQIKLEKEQPVHASKVAPSTSTHQLGWDENSSTESDTNYQENSSKQYQARRYDSITDSSMQFNLNKVEYNNDSDHDGEDDVDDSYFEYEKDTNNMNEIAFTTLMKSVVERHDRKEQLEVHPVDAFLTGLAPTLKSLTPYYLNIAKSRIFDVVQEIEMEQIVTVKSECVTPPETGLSSPIRCHFEPKIEIEEPPLSNLDHHNYASKI